MHTQSNLTKLVIGGGLGYIGTGLVVSRTRGWAKIKADNPPGSPSPTADIDTGQDLTLDQLKHPGKRPDIPYKQSGRAYQPFTPNYITGQTPSPGPISGGICSQFPWLSGCQTVIDPNTGKSVEGSCDMFGVHIPIPCWMFIGAGLLGILLLVKI